jgi:hypothetical protein
MKTLTSSLMVASLATTLAGTVFGAETTTTRQTFENHIRSLNTATVNNHAEKTTLHGVSVETGVPEDQVLQIHKNNPKTGPAGIFVACIIADHTKKDPETYVKQSAAGKAWAVIAQENNVPLDQIDERLARIEKYVNEGGDQKPASSQARTNRVRPQATQPTNPPAGTPR